MNAYANNAQSIESGGTGRAYTFDGLAAAMLDNRGSVVRWSRAAEDLTGVTAEEACGHPVLELVADLPDDLPRATQIPASGRVRLQHRRGNLIDVTFRTLKVDDSEEFLVLAVPTHHVADHEQGAALLRAPSSQNRITIALHDMDLTTVQTNATPSTIDDRPVQPGTRLCDVLCTEDAENLEAVLRQVLETGAPVVRRNELVSRRHDPARRHALCLSAFRLEDAQGCPTGVAALYIDSTDALRTRRNLDLAREVAEQVGRSLDVVRTAQDLANVLAPAFGDLTTVVLAQSVLDGDEPPKRLGGGDLHLCAAALAPTTAAWPAGIKCGNPVPPLSDHPLLRSSQHGKTVVYGRDDFAALIGGPHPAEDFLPNDAHTVMVAPLYARGLTLGNIVVWRTGRSDPFSEDETDLMKQIASRGALAIDNARRYTREHRAAVALQQRLLPPATTDTPAAETAGVYLPAGGGADIGGDWYDAIALPSLRLALVAGDVVGHGMPASATMGRLRAAIQTLADLELEPDELLTRIADLVQRLAAEAPPGDHDSIGATCLYAVYDPVTQRCALASAGHPPPVLVRPDGTAETIGISPGPTLSVSGMPYETTTIDLEPGSILALYTDGLIDRGDRDIDQGLRRLTDALAASCRPDRALDETGRTLLADLVAQVPRDDVTLLLARTRAIPAQDTAHWEIPADPAAVAEAREWTTRQLATWGLDELLFTTELIVSELVTNAIRYGRPPSELRLIRHNVLVCEVTDSSSTQPRLRRARTTDEGGRGLFLVAQLATRWGCRHGQNCKTIWSEQHIECPPDRAQGSTRCSAAR
ncbi:SpoIIE family protein phosphatase [Streptomyces sp. MI02-2A]|uniref:ATP-binding SpoIIE family protein phosphatase n=1 Tax=unclassified Streptomyces TaxID=2593676 RepID=UPI00099EBE8F|nr:MULTISPECIES: SpoIIE family protein phosphatase [unclassified Streptomyces]MDX3262097.1 SpoIIE family protein phosphatase [Streptomyces sp. MI02-2A]REE65853.1 PAS domain S-box-containing protein [Streptomyces sp. 3212.3]